MSDDIVVGWVACGNATEPIGPGEPIKMSDLTPEAQALLKAALLPTRERVFKLSGAARTFSASIKVK